MTYKNPYKKKSHLGIVKSRKIIRYFSEDITAIKTSKLLKIERKTVNRWYNYIREVIAYNTIREDKEIWEGIIEIDESYFGPTRIRGERGRGAGEKIKVLGLLKRRGKVYVQIVPDCSARSLVPIIRKKISDDSEVNTDGRKAYDGLVDIGYEKHYRVHHGANEFVRGKQHVNGIESFRSYTKRRLAKFNGIQAERYYLHLKETEFGFNCGVQKENIYKTLLKMLRSYTLNNL